MNDDALKPLVLSQFDLDSVLVCMENQNPIEDCFLDIETGILLLGSEGVSEAFGGEDADLNDPRFLFIDPIDSSEAFRYMERFAGAYEMPEGFRKRLFDALDRPKPFRRFRDVLHDRIEILDAFESYKSEQLTEELRDALRARGYRLVVEANR